MTLAVLGENGHGDQIQSLRFISRLLELPLRHLVICVKATRSVQASRRLICPTPAHVRKQFDQPNRPRPVQRQK
jgi:hypothetical protein